MIETTEGVFRLLGLLMLFILPFSIWNILLGLDQSRVRFKDNIRRSQRILLDKCPKHDHEFFTEDTRLSLLRKSTRVYWLEIDDIKTLSDERDEIIGLYVLLKGKGHHFSPEEKDTILNRLPI